MTDRAGRPGLSAVEGPTWMWKAGRFRTPVLIRTFPTEVPFGFLGGVAPTSAAVELRVEISPMSDAQADSLLRRISVNGEATVASAGSLAEGSEGEQEVERSRELARAVRTGEQRLWRVGLGFAALGGSERASAREAGALLGRLRALGFRAGIPRFEAGPSDGPGRTFAPLDRPMDWFHTLPTDGLAAMFPFADESVVEPDGVLVGLLLDDAAPIVLDRWHHASHSWGLFGTTGAGKTFASGLLLARSRWTTPGLHAVLLDPLGELEGLASALGGEVVRLEDREAIVNPLDPATTRGDLRAKAGRVSAMLRAVYPSLTDEEAAALDGALGRLYAGPADQTPTWSALRDQVRQAASAGRLGTLLEPFCSGSFASSATGRSIDWGAPILDLSLRGVPEAHRAFHLTYLLDALLERLRKSTGPTLLIVDEAHHLLQHGFVAEFFERAVREMRHYRAGALLLSQSPDDFLTTASGRVLLGNLRASLLFRLDPVSPAAKEFYGLTEAEAEWLRRARLPAEAGYSEALLRLGHAHLPIAVVASTAEYEFLRAAFAGERPPG